MAIISTLANSAKMTVSGLPGTGAITLLAAVPGFQTFAAAGIADGNLVSYVIEDGGNWEFGQGTYTASGTSLARTSIAASSASGAAINASSAALVYLSAFAADIRGAGAGNNTVGGAGALAAATSGVNNTAVGVNACVLQTSANGSAAFGQAALAANISSGGNSAFGNAALLVCTGDTNTAVGSSAGKGLTTGQNNTIIGGTFVTATYNQITTGSYNIAIGSDVAIATATASNQLCIGNLIYGTALDGRGATISSGSIGIGIKAPAAKMDVDGTIKPKSYTVAGLPAAGNAGSMAWASNGRAMNGAFTFEGAGAGTGCLVTDNGTAWKVAGTNSTVLA